MHRDLARASIALLASALAAAGAVAADPKPLAIGAPAPDFRLPGVDGKTYGLKDFADAKVLAVAFTCKQSSTPMRLVNGFRD